MYAIFLKGIGEEIVGIVGLPTPFAELERLYRQYYPGYFFPKHSILTRMQSMSQTLCWFGFQNQQRIICYIQRLTFLPPSLTYLVAQDPASNEPNYQSD